MSARLVLTSRIACPSAAAVSALQLVTQPERHLREEYTPLHRRLGEEQRRRSTKMALARLQQVGGQRLRPGSMN